MGTVRKSPASSAYPIPGKTGNGHSFAYGMAKMLAPWWKKGLRNGLAQGLAALLKKDEVPEKDALAVIQKLSEISEDRNPSERNDAVTAVYQSSDDVPGRSLLQDILTADAKEFLKTYDTVIRSVPPPPVKRTRFPEFNLFECIPSGSVFDQYVTLGNNITDAPIQFHVAAAVTLGAAALGNRSYIKFHGKRLYPTLYTLIVGPSSRYRKSTSVMQGYKVGKGAGVKAFPNNSTVEQMYADFCPDECEWVDRKTGEPCNQDADGAKVMSWEGRPAGITYHPEFTKFLDVSAKSYMQDSRSLLMDFYDGHTGRDISGRKTKTSGRYYVEDPAVSLLCGVTPTAMKNFCGRMDMGGGFLSRFLIVMSPPDHKNRFEWYRENEADNALLEQISERFRLMTLANGEIEPTQEAIDIYLEFDKLIHSKMEEFEATPMVALDPFLARLSTMSLKIAAVFASGNRVPAVRIEADEMRCAVNLCTYAASVLEHFSDAVRPEDRNFEVGFKNTVLGAVRGYVQKYGTDRIGHRALLQTVNLDAQQVARAIDSLAEEGRIHRSRTASGRGAAYILNEVEE